MPAYKKSKNPVGKFETRDGLCLARHLKRFQHLPPVATLSGAIAGGVEATVVWPTEYVKTLVQLDRGTTQRKYKGLFDCAQQQVRRDGFFGLYRGLAPTLAFSIPKAGIRFGGFQSFKNTLVEYDAFRTDKGNITMTGNLLCGMAAGALEAVFAVTPMDTLKVKLIDLNMGLLDGAKHIVRTEGVIGLYAGVVPSILKQSSNQGIRFMVFNSIWRPFMQVGTVLNLDNFVSLVSIFLCPPLFYFTM